MTLLSAYFAGHTRALAVTLAQLRRAPIATLLTVAVIGIALSLPATLYLVLDNVERVAGSWDTSGQISLFLNLDVSDDRAQRLAERVRRLPAVARVDYLSANEALTEFKRHSGLADVLGTLERNPLPAVLVVHPIAQQSTSAALRTLLAGFKSYPEVELAQLDFEWVQRLRAWIAMAQRGVGILAGLLSVAVLLIVGNTIRMAVLNRYEEIEVVKLIGGTDAFIRRPFLYSGLVHGLLGALFANVAIAAAAMALAGPVAEVAALYGSDFSPSGMGWIEALLLIGSGAGLGWLGARLAVGRHLRALEPT